MHLLYRSNPFIVHWWIICISNLSFNCWYFLFIFQYSFVRNLKIFNQLVRSNWLKNLVYSLNLKTTRSKYLVFAVGNLYVYVSTILMFINVANQKSKLEKCRNYICINWIMWDEEASSIKLIYVISYCWERSKKTNSSNVMKSSDTNTYEYIYVLISIV